MKRSRLNRFLWLGAVALAAWLMNGQWPGAPEGGFVATAKAVIGRPATPVSYSGVARRTTVRVATPGVGAPGVGATPGVGVGTPGVGAGAPGPGVEPGVNTPTNQGGPVNRVGRH